MVKKPTIKKHRHKWLEHVCDCTYCMGPAYECECGSTKNFNGEIE